MSVEGWKFCLNCNAAISKTVVKFARHDFPCPECRMARVAQAYSYGSYTHKEACLNWSELSKWAPPYVLRPVPFPKDEIHASRS